MFDILFWKTEPKPREKKLAVNYIARRFFFAMGVKKHKEFK